MEIYNNRYVVNRVISSDPYGKTLEVYDEVSADKRKLKLFNKQSKFNPATTFVDNFIRYSRALHPNLIRNYRFDIVDSKNNKAQEYFFTAEYLDERKRLDYTTLEYEERMYVLECVLRAITYLHFLGIVYGKLSFSNIFIYRDEDKNLRVKLNDLASVVSSSPTELNTFSDANFLVSRREADNLTPKADVYSIGMIIYYLVTGNDYMVNNMGFATLQQFDERLADIIAVSTHIDPDKRPDSVLKLWRRLSEILGIGIEFTDKESYERIDFSGSFVAHYDKRDEILNKLYSYFDGNIQDNVSFVRSRLGMGKTRFLGEINHRTRINGLNPVLLEVFEDEYEDSDYPSFTKLLRNLLKKYSLSQAVIERFGGDLVHLVPEYIDIWGVNPTEVNDEDVLHNRIVTRYLGLIDDISLRNQFVIIIDNVDKLNRNELDLLFAIIKSGIHKGPYLILSINDMPEEFQDWGIAEDYSFLKLESFNYHDTVKYVKRLLNIGNVAKLIARSMTGICHGNPRIMEQNVRRLHRMGRIRVSEDREWEILDLKYSITESEISEIGYENIEETLSELSPDAVKILKRLAIYSQRVDVFFAIRYSMIPGKVFLDSMSELLDTGIIFKTTSDWGNYYEFSDYRLMNYIYQCTSREERVELHAAAAETYDWDESYLDDAGFDSYVYHLIESNQKDLAIDVLETEALIYRDKGMLTQALEYYEYALSIMDVDEGSKKYLIFLNRIAETEYSMGNVEAAEKYYQKLFDLANKGRYIDLKISTLFTLIKLYIMQNRIQEATDRYNSLSENIDYKNNNRLFLEFLFLEITLHEANQEFKNIPVLVNKLKTLATENSDNLYLGLSLFLLGKVYLKNFEIKPAVDTLTQAFELLENEGEEHYKIEVMRLIGRIYLMFLSNPAQAKEYLVPAYEIAINSKRVWEYSKLIVDMGYLKFVEDDYEGARELYLKAENLAAKGQHNEALMLTAIRIAELSFVLEDYENSELQLNKYEDLFEKSKFNRNKKYYYNFLIIRAEVYLKFRVMPFVFSMIEKVKNDGVDHINMFMNYKFNLLRVKYSYISHVVFGDDFEINRLKDVALITFTEEEKNIFKEFLLDLAIEAYSDERFEIFSEAQTLALEFRTGLEKMNTAVKYEFVNSLNFADVDMVKPYAEHIAQDLLPYSWRVYCILADLQFKNGMKVEALANYIEASGQFYHRLTKIPAAYREKRKEVSFAIKKIESRVNILKEELYDLGQFDEESNMFSQKLKHTIVKDKVFSKIVKELYKRHHSISISTWQNLISRLDDDSRMNVEKLLMFLTEYTLSEYGAILLVDENEEIGEEFTTDKYYKDARILDYISKLKTKGLSYDYIEKTNTEITRAGWHSNKSILVFTIYLKEEESNLYYRRLADRKKSNKNILAYVYLESKKVINNLTINRYKNIVNYEGLTSLIISDYNMTKSATIDSLTGTYIRTYVQEKVAKLFEKHESMKWSFSVLMIDIDHFKGVNDNYGHRRGDEILASFGKILKKSVRKTDIVGRYGGEEFIVILLNASKQAAYTIGEKIRISVEDTKLLGDDRALTISIGASTYPLDGKQLETLVENADKALYHSKNNGRNMVSSYHPSMDVLSAAHYDIFSGIITPNASENNRRMKAVLDIVSSISTQSNMKLKMKNALSLVLDIIQGVEVGIISTDGSMFCKRRNDEKIYRQSILNDRVLNDIFELKEGGTFVKWKDDFVDDIEHKSPNRNTYAASKLIKDGRDLGKIFIWSRIKDKEYSYSDYSFLVGVSPLIATILECEQGKNERK